MLPPSSAAPLRPGHHGDARLALLIALLQADATSTGAMMAAEGEGSRMDRLVALAGDLARSIGALPPTSYLTKGDGP